MLKPVVVLWSLLRGSAWPCCRLNLFDGFKMLWACFEHPSSFQKHSSISNTDSALGAEIPLSSQHTFEPPHCVTSLQSLGLQGVKVTELTKFMSRLKSLAWKVWRAFFLLLSEETQEWHYHSSWTRCEQGKNTTTHRADKALGQVQTRPGAWTKGNAVDKQNKVTKGTKGTHRGQGLRKVRHKHVAFCRLENAWARFNTAWKQSMAEQDKAGRNHHPPSGQGCGQGVTRQDGNLTFIGATHLFSQEPRNSKLFAEKCYAMIIAGRYQLRLKHTQTEPGHEPSMLAVHPFKLVGVKTRLGSGNILPSPPPSSSSVTGAS